MFRRFSVSDSILAVILATGISAISGCGESTGDGYKGPVGTVSGKVTYKGQPIPEDCVVTFSAEKGGYSGTGKTNDKGEYTLTGATGSKLPAVKYLVQLGVFYEGGTATMDPAKSGQAPAPPPLPFPQKYTGFGSSKLEFTVKAGENKADFDLTD